jgi:hypothetical protein
VNCRFWSNINDAQFCLGTFFDNRKIGRVVICRHIDVNDFIITGDIFVLQEGFPFDITTSCSCLPLIEK